MGPNCCLAENTEGRRDATEGGYLDLYHPSCWKGKGRMLEVLREAVRSPNPIHHRGRGLRSLPLQPQPSLVPQSVGMGRARGRNPGPCPSSEPPVQILNTQPQCLNPNPSHRPDSPPSDNSSGPPSLESATSSESGYEAGSN